MSVLPVWYEERYQQVFSWMRCIESTGYNLKESFRGKANNNLKRSISSLNLQGREACEPTQQSKGQRIDSRIIILLR